MEFEKELLDQFKQKYVQIYYFCKTNEVGMLTGPEVAYYMPCKYGIECKLKDKGWEIVDI